MEYQVPQFIEVEEKIIGPFTWKQFIYLAGGGGLCAIILFALPLPRVFAVILCLPIAAFAGALAFYKVNNKNFSDMLEAGVKYYLGNRLFLWKKEKMVKNTSVAPTPTKPQTEPARQKLGLSQGKLQDLAWSLDIQDRQPPTNP